jgi:hypothetical protein
MGELVIEKGLKDQFPVLHALYDFMYIHKQLNRYIISVLS